MIKNKWFVAKRADNTGYDVLCYPSLKDAIMFESLRCKYDSISGGTSKKQANQIVQSLNSQV